MQNLTVTIIQTPLFWEDKDRNLARFDDYLDQSGPSDLVVLPEMFNTGFITSPEKVAEVMEGPTFSWIKRKSIEKRCVITGSLIIKDTANYYNRLVWMRPDGSYELYDKRHLFRMGGEHKHFSAGNHKLITELKGWRICPLVCYDLRFPVWSRNRFINGKHDYDMLIYLANWPGARSHAWKTLLAARAIENQVYVVGVNRIGEDERGTDHTGDSAVFDMIGHKMTSLRSGTAGFETVNLSYSKLNDFREKFKFGLDWDDISISL